MKLKQISFAVLTSALLAITMPVLNATGVTSNGALTVTATIDPCISLTFFQDGSGVALSSGSGTGTATVPLGDIAAYGYTPPSGITQALNASGGSASAFTVATPFDVLVMEANTASATHTLTATLNLNAADTTNSWFVDTLAVTSSGPTTITATGEYGSAISHTFLLSVPFSNTTHLAVSNALNFIATAN
jgi:hypothetical protein